MNTFRGGVGNQQGKSCMRWLRSGSNAQISLKISKGQSTTKVTAKDLDDIVLGDTYYTELQTNLDEATFKYEMLKGLVRALEQKKDMLQQISANKREETKLYK